jgi:hypothetical protein
MRSLLLLAENRSTLSLAGRPVDVLVAAEEIDDQDLAEVEPREALSRLYVLDGQQRLTSLVRVFSNISRTKVYYVDLIKVLESFGPNATEDADWIISRGRGVKEPALAKNRGHLIRADIVLDVKRSSLYLDEFIDELETSDLPLAFQKGISEAEQKKNRREAKAVLVQVFETIRNYRVPAIVIDRDSPLSAICRIFETINSTGRKLTTFDLAVASFYPEPDLRTLWEESLERSHILRRYEIDGERILQLLVLLSKTDGVPKDATRSAILGLASDRTYVRDNWIHAESSLKAALEWVERQGARPQCLPQEAVVISLAAFLGTDGVRDWLRRTPGANAQLEKWYFSQVLQAGARAASNYRISKEYETLLDWYRGGALVAAHVRLTVDELVNLATSDNRYKAIFCLLIRDVKMDFRNHEPLGQERIEDHHIYPRSLASKAKLNKRKLDGIANRLPTSFTTNRSLSNERPQHYMKELLQSPAAGITARVLADGGFSQPLDPDKLTVENFDSFIAERAQRLLDKVGGELNGLLLRSNDENEPDE